MKFTRIDFHTLRNEEWFQFFTEFKNLVNKFTPETLGIAPLFEEFITHYKHSDDALELIRKSRETELMNDADRHRDLTFRGLADAVKSARNHFSDVKRNAAQDLKILIDHYGNLTIKAPNEETAALYNFLQELREKYAEQIQLLGLNEWVDELDNLNRAYEELAQKRNAEVVSRTPYRMLTVRKEAQEVYRQITERIEALLLINNDSEPAAFVNELNGFLKQRKDVVAMRKGRKKEKGEEKK